jgi:hypothetical protein
MLVCLTNVKNMCVVKSGMAYVEIPAKPFLEEFMKAIELEAPVVSWRPAPEGLFIVGVQVNMGPADRIPSLYYEAAGATIPEAENAAALMVTYALLAAERQVEIRDINYPLVACQRQQIDGLNQKLAETNNLCVELMDVVRSSEKEVAFLERLVHRFYRRICCLKDTVAAL